MLEGAKSITFEEVFNRIQASDQVMRLLTIFLEDLNLKQRKQAVNSPAVFQRNADLIATTHILMSKAKGEEVFLPEILSKQNIFDLFPFAISFALLRSVVEQSTQVQEEVIPEPDEPLPEVVNLLQAIDLVDELGEVTQQPQSHFEPELAVPKKLRQRRTKLEIEYEKRRDSRSPAQVIDDALDGGYEIDDEPDDDVLLQKEEPDSDDLAELDVEDLLHQDDILDLALQFDSIGQYLREIMRYQLLTHEEEVALGYRVARGILDAQKMAKKKHEQYKDGDMSEDGKLARNILIESNTRLVVSIAKKYMGRGVPFPDLIQAGNLGLMHSVNKFDSDRGFRFSTFATWWIRQSITRGISDNGRTIRIPVHMGDRMYHLYKIEQRLEAELDRHPTVEEIAYQFLIKKMGYEPTEDEILGELKRTYSSILKSVKLMLSSRSQPLSLDEPVNDEESDGMNFGEMLFDEDQNTEVIAGLDSRRKKVLSVVNQLRDVREVTVLTLRYGLLNGKPMTLEEVAKKYALSRERIRQIEASALRHLRHPRYSRSLRDFIFSA